MKQRMLTSLTASFSAVIFLTTGLALAQDRGAGRGGASGQERTAEQERVQNRDPDRIADRDRLQDRDQDRLQDRAGVQDRDPTQDRDRLQDRDQLHVQDNDQLRSRDIFGSELMTRQERREYRNRIGEMETVQEWARYRAEHQERMMARAEEQGVDLPAPFYGQQLMTDQEREQLRERLREAASEQERERIRSEHREQMRERAQENQIPLDELE
jgi:hypothetical protein